MAYTHNFEIKVEGLVIEGEINFNHGEEAGFRTNAGEELSIKQHRKVQNLFESLVKFYKEVGDIEKIEVLRKV